MQQLSIKLESLMKEKKMAATEIQSAVEQFRTNSTTTLTALLGMNNTENLTLDVHRVTLNNITGLKYYSVCPVINLKNSLISIVQNLN